METDQKVNEAIELLAKHEETIGNLYRTFAEHFSDKKLWSQMAREEDLHAKWIRSFYENQYKGKVHLTPEFNPEQIWQSIRRIERMREDVNLYDETTAISYALGIESMVLEKQIINAFDEGDPAVQKVLLNLVRATIAHKAQIEERFSKLFQA